MMTALKLIKGIVNIGNKPSDIFPLFKDDFLFFENFKVVSMMQVKEITSSQELKDLVDELTTKISGHGRVVIHPSGTEPKIRVWVCGDDETMVNNFGNQLWNKIEFLANNG